MKKTDALILGSGPAGLTAAIYLCRAGVQPTLCEGIQPGGQLTTTTLVQNYPGFADGIDGNGLMENMRQQALSFGTEILEAEVSEVNLKVYPYHAKLEDGTDVEARTIIVATGATAKYLGLSDEEKYRGSGVSACATCDGFFYRNKVVAVVGGGDTACEEAEYLSTLANKVYMIVRKPFLRAAETVQERVLRNEKIEILFETNTLGLYGAEGVEGAHLVHRKGEDDEHEYDLPIDGLFLAIGHKPNSDLFKGSLQLDEEGYIVTQAGTPMTNVPGVFAAGDVCDPVYRQAVIAAASGAKAGIEAAKYVKEHGA